MGQVSSPAAQSGRYIPALTLISNLDAAVVTGAFSYIRVGTIVFFTGTINLTLTNGAIGATVDADLPPGLGSDFTASTDASGGGGGQGVGPAGCLVNATAATNRLRIAMTPDPSSPAASQTIGFAGSYIIR